MDNHVGMGYKKCPICGKEHDEVVLLAKDYKRVKGELQPVTPLSRHMIIGIELCEDCYKPGYVVIIEVDERRTQPTPDGRVDPSKGVYLTGRIAQVPEAILVDDFREKMNEPHDRILMCGKETMDILVARFERGGKSSTDEGEQS